MSGISRRAMLATAAAASVAPFVKTSSAFAAPPQADKQAPGYYRYKVGEFQVTAVTDGANTFPLPDSFVTNVKKDQVNTVLEAAYLPRDRITIPFTPIVVNTGSKLVVIDTGSGASAAAQPNSTAGQFMTNFRAAGFDPNAVDAVIISHFHSDHVNGLLDSDSKLAFPNAEVLVPSVEWKFWMDDGEMSRAPAGRMEGAFKNNRRVFDALKRKVTPYEWGKDVMSGITATGTPGHTPGHTSYVIASGSGKVFVQSDVTNRPELFLNNPGWHSFFDQDPQLAETTRRKIYDMVAAEKMSVQGFHFPFPALGYVDKTKDGYRLVTVPWSPTL